MRAWIQVRWKPGAPGAYDPKRYRRVERFWIGVFAERQGERTKELARACDISNDVNRNPKGAKTCHVDVRGADALGAFSADGGVDIRFVPRPGELRGKRLPYWELHGSPLV